MENFYILNTKTGSNFDTNENKFYPASWEPVMGSKEYLQSLINNNPEKFKNCIVTE